MTPAVSTGALTFLSAGQDPDGGWSFYPNTVATPGSTDPDSTALVIQSLIALGLSPTSASFTKGPANPVSALLTFQLTSGSDAGAFFFPPAPAPAKHHLHLPGGPRPGRADLPLRALGPLLLGGGLRRRHLHLR